eukprot:scaffold2776_cov365-Prasinococcus_capsulatus_cf.AAC.3
MKLAYQSLRCDASKRSSASTERRSGWRKSRWRAASSPALKLRAFSRQNVFSVCSGNCPLSWRTRLTLQSVLDRARCGAALAVATSGRASSTSRTWDFSYSSRKRSALRSWSATRGGKRPLPRPAVITARYACTRTCTWAQAHTLPTSQPSATRPHARASRVAQVRRTVLNPHGIGACALIAES